MAGKQLARTSYRINEVNIPAILLNDQDMHNLDALWRAAGKPKDREPHNWLDGTEAKMRIAAVAKQFRIDSSLLIHTNAEGHWATQLVAVHYARRLSERFGVMVDQLAILAAKKLHNKADALYQEVRHNGKIAHAETSGVRDQYRPKLVNGVDLKHPIANARLCEAINGKKPKDLKDELGLRDKDSLWDALSAEANALRLVALVYEKPKLEAALERTDDPDVMIRIVEDNARKVRLAAKQIES